MQYLVDKTLKPLTERIRRFANNYDECDVTSEYDFEEYRLHLALKDGQKEDRKASMPAQLKERRRALRSIEVDKEVHCRATWALSDTELRHIIRHFGGKPEGGIRALIQADMTERWRPYMQLELMSWWLDWLFESQTNTYRCLSELLKSHSEGTLSCKAVVITQILLRTSMRQMVARPVSSLSLDISKYFRAVIESYLDGLFHEGEENVKLWQDAFEGMTEGNQLRYYIEGIVQFYLSTSLISDTMVKVLHCLEISHMLDDICSGIVALSFGYGKLVNYIPLLLRGQSTMLSVAQVTFLSYLLKGEACHRLAWEMLYNCGCDGKSYHLFNRKVVGESSTVIIFRDEHQHMFGAYLDRPWHRGKQFFGDEGCFLFRLHPSVVILPASPTSTNRCYFNYDDASNPTGIGFGGDKDFFGLHIELESKRGVCADACLTFTDFERLSKHNYFHCSNLEVWKLYPEWDEEEREHKKMFNPIPISHLYY